VCAWCVSQRPALDSIQNNVLLGAQQVNGYTTIAWERKWNTTDPMDRPIQPFVKVPYIYAYQLTAVCIDMMNDGVK